MSTFILLFLFLCWPGGQRRGGHTGQGHVLGAPDFQKVLVQLLLLQLFQLSQ
uniref:Uncharacterized protein n=1 Tax=Anguilla anguilla TaxID=7936 RepID=A0A0E9PBD3_ANGAN